MQLCLAIEPFCQCLRSSRKSFPRNPEALQLPLDPAEKKTSPCIGVVIGMADAAAIRSHPACELTHQAGTIWTDHLQDDRGLTHDKALKNKFSRARRAG